jgi:TonB family protein
VRFSSLLTSLAVAVAACGRGGEAPPAADSTPDGVALQPPVPLDPVPAIAYPRGLDDTTASLTVQLRLFVDEQGHVVADSTRIAESSGVAALDSAALAGAPHLRYAPALRDGHPTATAFVQPVEFRRP